MKTVKYSKVVILLVTASLTFIGCGSGGGGSDTPTESNTVQQTLSAPSGVTATAGNGQVTVTWSVVSEASGYNVYRGTATGALSAKTAVSTNVTAVTYNDTTTTNGTTYYYQVAAINASGESAGSNEVNAVPSTTTGENWTKTVIDTTGEIGSYTSIAVDSNSKVHISYNDKTNGDLKYATNVNGQWEIAVVDSTGTVGRYSSIAVDSLNKLHISYSDDSNYDLKYATNSSGSWVTSIVGSAVVQNTSIAVVLAALQSKPNPAEPDLATLALF